MRSIAAGLWLSREVALGVVLETAEAAWALEAERPAPVAGGYPLARRDVAAADDARRSGLVSRVDDDEFRCDSHYAASTMIRPRSMPIWRVNSCSPGPPGMNSTGTTVSVGSGADLPTTGRTTCSELDEVSSRSNGCQTGRPAAPRLVSAVYQDQLKSMAPFGAVLAIVIRLTSMSFRGGPIIELAFVDCPRSLRTR